MTVCILQNNFPFDLLYLLKVCYENNSHLRAIVNQIRTWHFLQHGSIWDYKYLHGI